MHRITDGITRQLVYIADTHRTAAIVAYSVVFACAFWTLGLKAQAARQDDGAAIARFSVPVYPLGKSQPITAQSAASNIPITATGETWPMRGIVTTQFGQPHRPWQATHTGIDISSAARSGATPITTFRAGTVVATNRTGGFGNHVIVDHGGGLTSLYGHLHTIAVYTGQQVRPGDTLGHEGSTGNSTGTHLHFELRQDGRPINPGSLLPGRP